MLLVALLVQYCPRGLVVLHFLVLQLGPVVLNYQSHLLNLEVQYRPIHLVLRLVLVALEYLGDRLAPVIRCFL
jgi:hypothetical protein